LDLLLNLGAVCLCHSDTTPSSRLMERGVIYRST
jgi:hypothetical protein